MAQQCLIRIQNAARDAGGELLDDEVQDILDQLMDEYVKSGKAITSQSQVDALIAKAKDISVSARTKAKIQRRNKLINAARYAHLSNLMKRYPDDPSKAIRHLLVSSYDVGLEGGGVSVASRQHSINLDSLGALLAELQKSDLVNSFRSGQLDAAIYKELFDGAGSSKIPEARMIADAIRKAQKRLLLRKNRAGAFINEIPNYVTRQTHNSALLRDAGAEAWINDILPLLDEEATFGDLPDGKRRREFLLKTYNALVTGVHQKTDQVRGVEGSADPLTGFKGQANLAKKLSSERVLHFKNGSSAFKYANKYSGKNLMQSVLDGFSHDAQSLSLMEAFGTNPRAMLDRLLDDMGKMLAKDPTIKFGRRQKNTLKRQFDELDGSTRNVGATDAYKLGVDWSAISASFRAIENITKLGYAVFTSFGDLVTRAQFLQDSTGRGFFSSYATSLRDVFRLFPSSKHKELSYLLDVGAEAIIGDVHARFGADDPLPGRMSKLQQGYFKLNGMYFWNNAMKTGIARVLAADMVSHVGKSFSSLPVGVQNILKHYNLGESELALFRGLDMKAADGRKYFVAALVDDIPDERLDVYIRDSMGTLNITDEVRQGIRDDLRTRVSTYYTDSVEAAVPTPGARERSILNQGYARGTLVGEVIRMMTQFKGFPTSYITKGLMRTYYARRASGQSGYLGVAQLVVGMTVMGYVSGAVKDVLRGRTPMAVFDEDTYLRGDTFTRALLSGGGMGILGDFFFAEYDRYGRSLQADLMGPAFGTANEMFKIAQNAIRGDVSRAGEKAIDTARSLVPNLFMTDTAMNYLILYGFSEMLEPGFMRKLERKTKKRTGQEYFLPPSQYAIQF
jgi:hypothetical protein